MIELIILVDYENVQPAAEDLADLEVGKHLLKVFHGPGQNSMPIKLATTLMPVGAAVEFIQCEKAGKDALDFHLSFHFGRLSIQHPQAQYVIVSRDRKGFSQLIEHGGKLGLKVTLVPSLRNEDINDDGTPVVRAEPAPRTARQSRTPRVRTGARHIRVYRPVVGRWEAHALQPDWPVMDSERDGLVALAVLTAVSARWG